MRHRNKTKKCNSHYKSIFASMAFSLVEKKKIETTLTKAKLIRPYLEKVITLAKKGDDLNSRRYLLSKFFGKKDFVDSLFELSKDYVNRQGGYLRIIRTGFRKGDAAPTAIVAFV